MIFRRLLTWGREQIALGPEENISGEEATRRSSAFLVSTMASFLTPFMSSSVNVALPSIGRSLGMDALLLGWVASAFLLSAVVFLVPMGRVADIQGRKRVFTWGAVIYTISSAVCALAAEPSMLIAARVGQGAGGAMIFGTGMAILTSVFPVSARGRVLGYNVAAVYLGLSLGPFVGGFLTEHFGWRSVFAANVPLGLTIIGVVVSRLKGEWAEASGEGFDFPGSVLYGVSFIALMYGLSTLTRPSGVWWIVGGFLALVAFFRWERRATWPIVDLQLFRGNTVFLFSNVAALINYSATFAVTFLLSVYLQHIRGLGPQAAGVVLVAQPVVMAVLSPVAGRMSDTIEPRIVASVGMGLSAIGLGLLALLQEATPMLFIVAGLVILGAGFALFSSPNTNAVMSAVERKVYGVAAATLGTMRLTGQMFSMGIAMLFLAIHIGRVALSEAGVPETLLSVRQAFTLFALLCVFGVAASLARGKVR